MTPERLAQIRQLVGSIKTWEANDDGYDVAIGLLCEADKAIFELLDTLAAVTADRDRLHKLYMEYVARKQGLAFEVEAVQARTDRLEQRLTDLIAALRALPSITLVSAKTNDEPARPYVYLPKADLDRLLHQENLP
jgi:hypothetical protein